MRISKEQYPDIEARYMRGETLPAIAAAYQRNHATIIYHIKKMKLPRRQHPRPKVPAPERILCRVRHCGNLSRYSNQYCQLHYYRSIGHVIKRRNSHIVTGCNHRTSACECINPGKFYESYKVIHKKRKILASRRKLG